MRFASWASFAIQVKAAEAEAEAKYLSGVGVSRQRQAIIAGLRDSIHDFSSTIAGTTPKDVMVRLHVPTYKYVYKYAHIGDTFAQQLC